MPFIFRCQECGYTAPVGEGGGWPTCPACGGNRVATIEVKARPSPPQPPAEPPAAEEESE